MEQVKKNKKPDYLQTSDCEVILISLVVLGTGLPIGTR